MNQKYLLYAVIAAGVYFLFFYKGRMVPGKSGGKDAPTPPPQVTPGPPIGSTPSLQQKLQAGSGALGFFPGVGQGSPRY